MPRYTKNPMTIEAHQWHGAVGGATEIINWILENGGTARFVDYDEESPEPYIVIDTLEGPMQLWRDSWAIQGIAGEFYPCKPEIFAASYHPADD